MARMIPLKPSGCHFLFALVSDEDFHIVSQYEWYPYTHHGITYPRATVNGSRILMHKLVLKDAPEADHKDHNGLNNTRDNVRAATGMQNQANKRRLAKKTSSKYKGVYPSRRLKNPWEAKIECIGSQLYLGMYPTEEDAARAYNAKAREYHGEFAFQNIIT